MRNFTYGSDKPLKSLPVKSWASTTIRYRDPPWLDIGGMMFGEHFPRNTKKEYRGLPPLLLLH